MPAPEIIALHNQAVADELAAIHQYMYFHFHLDDQGFESLAALFKKTATARWATSNNWRSARCSWEATSKWWPAPS